MARLPSWTAWAMTAKGIAASKGTLNIASAMVNMIELARQFDMQIKSLHNADENAQSATKLLQSSS